MIVVVVSCLDCAFGHRSLIWRDECEVGSVSTDVVDKMTMCCDDHDFMRTLEG